MMVQHVSLLVLFCLLYVVGSVVPPYPKDCPKIYPVQMAEINSTVVIGKWYEVLHSTNLGYTCTVYQTRLIGDLNYSSKGQVELKNGTLFNFTLNWHIVESDNPKGAVSHFYKGYFFEEYAYVLYCKDIYVNFYCMENVAGKTKGIQVYSPTIDYDRKLVQKILAQNGLENVPLVEELIHCSNLN